MFWKMLIATIHHCVIQNPRSKYTHILIRNYRSHVTNVVLNLPSKIADNKSDHKIRLHTHTHKEAYQLANSFLRSDFIRICHRHNMNQWTAIHYTKSAVLLIHYTVSRANSGECDRRIILTTAVSRKITESLKLYLGTPQAAIKSLSVVRQLTGSNWYSWLKFVVFLRLLIRKKPAPISIR
jgi:hypothetical protein